VRLIGGRESGLWPTPRAEKTTDEKEETWQKRKDRGGVSTPPLTLAVKMYPTPTICGNNNRKGLSKTSGDGLATAVKKKYPTPTSSAGGPEPEGKTGRKLTTVIINNAAMETTVGQLNPDWVEWLMLWPIKWTSLSPIKLDWRTWNTDPADTGEIPRVATGIKNRVNRLKAIGNGQVPAALVLAWKILTGENQ
jgi:DNA (cytosine-5)-methyltransferase 1